MINYKLLVRALQHGWPAPDGVVPEVMGAGRGGGAVGLVDASVGGCGDEAHVVGCLAVEVGGGGGVGVWVVFV